MYQLIRSRTTRALGAVAAALLLTAPGLVAQAGSITGRVTDAQSGQPISSAQVFIADLDLGVLTQQNGAFSLQDVPAGTQTVTVQRLGYQETSTDVTVTAGQATVQNFGIEQTALQLDEVIVTGTAGGTQRRAMGNSVERMDAAALTERATVGNMQGLLAGRTPGLRFGRLDGQVGGGSGISIRGVSSVSLGAQPLIYVDGVRVRNDATLGPNTGSSSNASALNDLNPDEIASIEVVKGPAAATLYGTEASAGVIQIITKRGEVGAPEFTFETSQGTNFMRDPAGTLGTQYACSIVTARCPQENIVAVNLYEEASDYMRRQGRFEGVEGGGAGPRDRDLFQNGYSQGYNLSVRGGSDQVRYFLSGSWNDDVGVLDYNTDTSTSLRANVTVLMTENLNLDISTGYSQGETQFATIDAEGGVWHQLVWGRPSNLPGVRSESGSGFLGFQERWPENYEETNVGREYSRFTGSMTASHTFRDWLSQRVTVGVDKAWDTDTEFIPGSANFPNAPDGALNYNRPIEQYLTFDYSASGTYQLTDAIGTTTSVGARYYARQRENVLTSGQGFATEVQRTINQADPGLVSVGFSSIENKTLGFFVQEQVSFDDRIFLTAALSGDDNSAFGSDFALQYYPNVQASWVVSQESFWNIDAINSLRVRGAWGQSGRQPSTFASQTLYSTFEGPDGNGLIPSTSGNPDIGPEVTSELDVGFDIALWDDRLSGEFSYYNTTTSDLLVNQSLAPSTGLPGSRDANLGEMTTWGWEASVNAQLIESENYLLDLNIAADYTTNEITSLGEGILPTGNFQIGWPFPNIASDYILASAELSETGRAINVMCDLGQPAASGGPDIMRGGPVGPCGDYNGPGLLMGPSYPNYTVRFGPTLTIHQDLQVFSLAEGQYGRWIASTDANYACRFYRSCLKAVERTDPLFLAGTSSFLDDRYNGRYLSDFWKLREVGVRYTLPQTLVDRVGADRASLSVSGRNLLTIWQRNDTDLSGNPIYDPEYAINSSNPAQTALWEMPGIAAFNASLRVTF